MPNVAACISLALAVSTTLAGCNSAVDVDDAGPAVIDFDTRTNIYTINAPINEKRRVTDDIYGKVRWVFGFEVRDGSQTSTATATVARDVYDAYCEGDWIHLRCVPAEDCVVIS